MGSPVEGCLVLRLRLWQFKSQIISHVSPFVMKIEIFQILGILVEFQKPVNTGCFCLKVILSSGFSSEILQLLSSIDKASSKGTEKSTACPIKFQTFIGPHQRFTLILNFLREQILHWS